MFLLAERAVRNLFNVRLDTLHSSIGLTIPVLVFLSSLFLCSKLTCILLPPCGSVDSEIECGGLDVLAHIQLRREVAHVMRFLLHFFQFSTSRSEFLALCLRCRTH